MKIKIFNFMVSQARMKRDGGGFCLESDEAEFIINKFILDKDVIDIKANTYTVDRHNNGGCDDVWITYTILYK